MAWYTQGNDAAPDIVLDLNIGGGYTASGGTVSEVANLGSYSTTNFSATGTEAAEVSILGLTGMTFDAGATISRYDGAATFGAAFGDTTRVMYATTIYVPTNQAGPEQASQGQ